MKGNFSGVGDSGIKYSRNYGRLGFRDILARSIYITQQSVCVALKSFQLEA